MDLLGQRRLGRAIQFKPQRFGHGPWYTIFVRSWFFSVNQGRAIYGGDQGPGIDHQGAGQ
ncbi:hypothetical protein ABIF20_003401 [Bradyrhizobium japonicum]|uniref:hypothetical protein n=1 Tax=Bradyrhizobium japonicum TaxID=375 RepID=UPI0038353AA1